MARSSRNRPRRRRTPGARSGFGRPLQPSGGGAAAWSATDPLSATRVDLYGLGRPDELVIVDRLVPSAKGCADPEFDRDLRGRLLWELALDQRAFGPRRVLVAGADADGMFVELAHTPRTDPPELAAGFCLRTLGPAAVAAVVYCDEPVDVDARGADLDRIVERLHDVRAFAHEHLGLHLVDWLCCDDDAFRSSQLLADPDGDPWAPT